MMGNVVLVVVCVLAALGNAWFLYLVALWLDLVEPGSWLDPYADLTKESR